ncbi:MAG: AI-2 transport protein TqsA [Paraglaciecola sp.]
MSYLDPGVAMSMATNLLSSLGGVLTNFLLILLIVVFMLFEAESLPKKIHIALDDPSMKIQQIDKFLVSVKNYLAIKTLVSLATGLVIGVWLYFLGIDHFLLWAVLSFLLNYIPNIGSIIAAIPAVLLALVQLGPAASGLTALGYVVTNLVMGNVIEPRYMGRGLGLSTLVVFLSLIFWGWLLGTVGMLLSVPLTMIVKIALESSQDTRWLALLLASETEELDNTEKLEVSETD